MEFRDLKPGDGFHRDSMNDPNWSFIKVNYNQAKIIGTPMGRDTLKGEIIVISRYAEVTKMEDAS